MTQEPRSRKKTILSGCAIAAAMPLIIVAMSAIVLLVNNRPPKIEISSYPIPKINAWNDFEQAAKLAGKIKPSATEVPESEWSLQQLEKAVNTSAPVLAAARKGLAKECMAPTVRGDVLFPEFIAFRQIARDFRTEAYYYQRIGENEKAAGSLLDAAEFGVMFQRGGVLITHLVGISCEAIGTRDLPQFVEKLNKQQLEHVAHRLDKIENKRWPFSEIVLEEGRYTVSNLAQMFSDPKERSKIVNPVKWVQPSPFDPTYELTGEKPTFKERLSFIGPNARFAFVDKRKLITQMDSYFKAVAAEQSKPFSGKSRVKEPSTAPEEFFSIDFSRARASSCKAQAKIALLQADVAIRRYFADNDSYPKSLSDLMSKYLKMLPVDPFDSGKPVKYALKDAGKNFIVYSVGANMRDDGGKPGKWVGVETSGDLVLGTK